MQRLSRTKATVLAAAAVATAVSLAVSATVFDAGNWGVYMGGIALLAVTYALIGVILGRSSAGSAAPSWPSSSPSSTWASGRAPCCAANRRPGHTGCPGTPAPES